MTAYYLLAAQDLLVVSTEEENVIPIQTLYKHPVSLLAPSKKRASSRP